MCSHVISVICCEVMRCNGMGSYEFVMRCGWLRCHVVWFEVVVWGELEDDLVIRTAQYYKVLLQYYSVLHSTTPVLQSTTPVLLRTTQYYSSTTLYYKVLRQYYSVLQNTTPVLLCTAMDYSVLQSTTPGLLCTTKYYSSLVCTTKHYSSTSPVLLCTTKYYSSTTIYIARSNRTHVPTSPNIVPSHDWCPSHMKLHLQCAEQHDSPSNPTKYCTYHGKWHAWLIIVTYGGSLRCAEQQASPSNLTKYCACHAKVHSKIKEKFAENSWSVNSNAGSIRTWIRTRSEHELLISHPPVRRGYFSRLGDAFCIEDYNMSRSGYLPKFHRILRRPRKVTLRHHQILRLLRLPRKVTLMIDLHHIWNVIHNARSNRHHPPTSANTVPAT